MNNQSMFVTGVALVSLLIQGCNQPIRETSINSKLLDAELVDLLDKDIRLGLNSMSMQTYEKALSICPQNLANIQVIIESVQEPQSQSSYLKHITMILTDNDGFQIEVGDRGSPVNRGTQDTVIMSIPYLVTCSKESPLNRSWGQNQIEVFADGRVQVE